MSEYLTVDGVAEFLGKKRKAVEKMVERRLVPFRKHGKRIIFQRAELAQFFDKLPDVSLEEAERRVGERIGRSVMTFRNSEAPEVTVPEASQNFVTADINGRRRATALAILPMKETLP